MTSTKHGDLLCNIQFLRAAAALFVVFNHTTGAEGVRLGIRSGSFGVDIFFVISGFIISYITFSAPANFFVKRMIRIMPFYWAATALLFTVAMFMPSVLHHASADVPTLLYSLFFIPHMSANGLKPTLSLGWTLNYEMYFYAVFAFALKLSHKYASLICGAVILAILAGIKIVAPSNPALAFYGDTIVVEFIFGMVVFQLYRLLPERTCTPNWRNPSLAALVMLFVASIVYLLLRDVSFSGINRILPLQPRFISAGIPSMLIVGSAIAIESRYGLAVRARLCLLMGEASYVMYLIHPYLVFFVTRVVFPQVGSWPLWYKIPMICTILALVSAISILIHLRFEKPVMAALRRTLLRTPPPVIFGNPKET